MSSTLVRLFTRPSCSLCVPVKFVIQKNQNKYSFRYEEVDISQAAHSQWLEQYDWHIPVVHVNGEEIARHGLKEEVLVKALEKVECKKL